MKNFLKYIFMLTVITLIASCSEDYLDVNVDPNNPVTVGPELVLPVAQTYTAIYIQTDRRCNTFGNLMMYNWSQSDGYSWYSDEFKYNITTSFYANIFNVAYRDALKQYNVLDLLGPEFDYYKAISKIMKSFHFQILVDTYGDVPYSEALGRSLNPTPKYDDAQTIYEDLIVQLTAAISLIDNASDAAVMPENDDIMFGGDMTMWKKLANTIKLRILVRQSDISGRGAYIQEKINEILAEGSGFITTDVSVNPGYLQEVDKQNPLWDSYKKDAAGTDVMNGLATCATPFVLDLLTATNDPRIDRIYEKPATGHLGVVQGLLDYDTPVVDAYMPDKVSNIGPGILQSADMNAVIFALSESYFNQAEAALKGYLSDAPKDLYEMGITASFEYLGLEAADASAYYSQIMAKVGWNVTPEADRLETIITQKWIALNGIDAIQSWFDYNRTGFPSDLPISELASTPDRPVRLFYPAGELSSNKENVPSQPDGFTEKVFWAQ